MEKIHDVAKLVEAGSDAIEKELSRPTRTCCAETCYARGLALVKAKIAEIEKPAASPAPAPAPTPARPRSNEHTCLTAPFMVTCIMGR